MSDSRPVPFHRVEGSKKPTSVEDRRFNEINTQRSGDGSKGGSTAGQGPALESK